MSAQARKSPVATRTRAARNRSGASAFGVGSVSGAITGATGADVAAAAVAAGPTLPLRLFLGAPGSIQTAADSATTTAHTATSQTVRPRRADRLERRGER